MMRVLAFLAVTTVIALGCGEDRPDAATDLGTGPAGGGAAGDGGTRTEAGAACDLAGSVDTTPVSETFVNSPAGPDPLGGEVPSGRYMLTSITRFESWNGALDDDEAPIEPPPTSDLLEAKTLVIDGATYRFATRTGTIANGVGQAVEVTSGTLSARGSTLILAQACPSTGGLALGFTTGGTSISIYTSPTRRETFSPQPEPEP